jgi:arylsulfatase A-like enzyme
MKPSLSCWLIVVLLSGTVALQAADPLPNVVLIMADDLGYGDVQPLNPESRVPTPAFNRLAAEGITFSDAHTPSAVCTPTRYGLLTGRYCWRTALKRGVLNGYGLPLIEKDRETLGSLMRRAGYRTAVVGKWHLGLGLPGSTQEGFDFSKRLSHYPGTVGFDQSFVIPASLDFPPYVYFRDGLATTPVTVEQVAVGFPAFTRKGPRAADFNLQTCLDRLADEAVAVVESIKDSGKPTFLYFPLTAPHKPVLPNEKYADSTELGPYADFLRQVDATIGRVLDAIDREGLINETLIIVTSDNGSFMKRIGDGKIDHVDDEAVQGYRVEHHAANGPWRGTKADIWEAGHRVPLFVRLPNGKYAGTRKSEVVGLIDVMATLAEIVDTELPESAGEDSVSFAPLLRGKAFDRPPLICHSSGGMFAVRHGQWKLIAGNGSGGRQAPRGKPFAEPWMLIDLEQDPGEINDVADKQTEVFSRMKKSLIGIKGND